MDEALIDRIYEAGIVPGGWPTVLHDVGLRHNAAGGVLFTSTPDRVLSWSASPGLVTFVRRFIEEDWMARNTRAARAIALDRPGFVHDLDFFTLEEIEQEPVYEFFRREGGGFGIGTVIRPQAGDVAIFSWERPHGLGPFGEPDRVALDPYRSHLARAGLISTRLNLERTHAATAVLGLLGLPVCALSHANRIVSTNMLFEEHVPSVIQDTHDRVRITDPRADALLGHALDAIRAHKLSAVSSVPIRKSGQKGPMIGHLVPIRGAACDVFQSASALLILTTVRNGLSVSTEILQGLFDLTPAEAEVARAIGQGLTIADIASRRGVALLTARTQLKSVLAKTGVSRQAELVALLSNVGSSLAT